MKGDKFLGIPRNSPWRINEAIEKAMANPQPAKPVRVKQPRRNVERDTIHVPVMEWIYANEDKYPVLRFAFHAPNEGRRGYKGQQAVAQLGVRKGVPDLFLPLPGAYEWCGIALEFKAPGNSLTPEQANYLAYLRRCNWYADVCYSSARGIHAIEAVFGLRGHNVYEIQPDELQSIADRYRPEGFNDAF